MHGNYVSYSSKMREALMGIVLPGRFLLPFILICLPSGFFFFFFSFVDKQLITGLSF